MSETRQLIIFLLLIINLSCSVAAMNDARSAQVKIAYQCGPKGG